MSQDLSLVRECLSQAQQAIDDADKANDRDPETPDSLAIVHLIWSLRWLARAIQALADTAGEP